MRPGLIFDGDDTLWDNQAFYNQAKRTCHDIVVGQGSLAKHLEAARMTGDDFVRFVDEIDVRRFEREGFSKGRFSKSLVRAYETLSVEAGLAPDAQVSQRLRRLGDSVPQRPRSPLPGARETLEALSAHGTYTLVLYSAGEATTQLRKLRETGLEEFFAGRVHIVEQKDDAALRAVIEAENLDLPSSWMVGNSLRSDINPALRVGLNCIWFHNGVWAYDEVDMEPGQVYEIHALPDILEILAAGASVRKLVKS